MTLWYKSSRTDHREGRVLTDFLGIVVIASTAWNITAALHIYGGAFVFSVELCTFYLEWKHVRMPAATAKRADKLFPSSWCLLIFRSYLRTLLRNMHSHTSLLKNFRTLDERILQRKEKGITSLPPLPNQTHYHKLVCLSSLLTECVTESAKCDQCAFTFNTTAYTWAN